MKTSELLRRAWEAVDQSGVPESLHEAAFHEAVEHVRASEEAGGDLRRSQRQHSAGRAGSSSPKTAKDGTAAEETAQVDEATFFARLAEESGVSELELRDVLSLTDGNVHITQPTRNLGGSMAEQAKTAIVLVAGARAFGLGEHPVAADRVRRELGRKRCYHQDNFASKHLRPLAGFNAGANRTEIVTTSKWVGEFSAAVVQALGREKAGAGKKD